jgi:hypothetical protein
MRWSPQGPMAGATGGNESGAGNEPRPLIHRSAWKGNSANFASTEFLEVRLYARL